MDHRKAFTLIELLLVVAIVSALAVAVFVSLNPAQRLKDARDARRVTDVDTILSAIHTYIVDNKGTIPSGLNATEKQLGTAVTGCAISTGTCAVAGATDCVDLTTPLANYLKTIPMDPLDGTAALTGYSVVLSAEGLVTVKACKTGTGTTEGSVDISASR